MSAYSDKHLRNIVRLGGGNTVAATLARELLAARRALRAQAKANFKMLGELQKLRAALPPKRAARDRSKR